MHFIYLMGIITTQLVPFTKNDVLNKELIIRMLKYETAIALDPNIGARLYDNTILEPLTTLNVEKILNRLTLIKFNFDATDESVKMYRTIFSNYYQSPTSYDHDVINASYYMRNNKTVFYKSTALTLNDTIPNVPIHTMEKKIVMLHEIIDNLSSTMTIIAAFSLS